MILFKNMRCFKKINSFKDVKFEIFFSILNSFQSSSIQLVISILINFKIFSYKINMIYFQILIFQYLAKYREKRLSYELLNPKGFWNAFTYKS